MISYNCFQNMDDDELSMIAIQQYLQLHSYSTYVFYIFYSLTEPMR